MQTPGEKMNSFELFFDRDCFVASIYLLGNQKYNSFLNLEKWKSVVLLAASGVFHSVEDVKYTPSFLPCWTAKTPHARLLTSRDDTI